MGTVTTNPGIVFKTAVDCVPQTMTASYTVATPEYVSRPIFAVSDLHIGDGGPRDNFAAMSGGNRRQEFKDFLQHVRECKGELVIVGDLFDFWQANLSKVLVQNEPLLDELAAMNAVYVLGNHDSDLLYFGSGSKWLCHPFFKTMRRSYDTVVGNTLVGFLHGHQVDKYCVSDTPGIGRATAIYTGLKEDRHGSPLLSKTKTVENAYLGWMERLVGFGQKLIGEGGRLEQMNRDLLDWKQKHDYDMLVVGHTHLAGHIGNLCNAGTWAEQVCSFVRIEKAGGTFAMVYDWVDGEPRVQNRLLKT